MPESHFHLHIPKRPVFAILFSSFVVLVFGIIFLGFYNANAGQIQLFASQCLGDWQHSENATGEPSGSDDFTEENSAVFSGDKKQIFCGGFYGKLPENSEITSVNLSLKWKILDKNIEIKKEENTPILESLLFTPVAYAEEVPEILPDTPVVSAPEQPSENIPVESNPILNDVLPPELGITTDEVITPTFIDTETTEVFHKDELFKIKYSIDGITWIDGAIITRENFSNSIPLTIKSIDDLAKLKISVEPIVPANDFSVFLDAVALDVSYTETHPVVLEKFLDDNVGSDFKKLSVKNLSVPSGVHLNVANDPDQGESIEFSIDKHKASAVFFYKEKDPTFSMTIGLGDQKTSIPAYQFSAGHFFLVFTKDVEGCTSLSIEECEKSDGYVTKASFDIDTTDNTPFEYQKPIQDTPVVKEIIENVTPEIPPLNEEKKPDSSQE